MKKIMAFLLVVMLVLGLAACSGQDGQGGKQTAGDGTGSLAEQPVKPKIGMFGTTTTDVAIRPRFDNAIAFVEAIGGEVVNAEVENNDYVSALETLINAGCNGVIFESVDEASLAVYIAKCEAAKVYFVCTDTNIPEEGDIGELIKNSNYYLGCLGKSEVQNGYDCASMLGRQGGSKVGLLGIPITFSMGADRDAGFKKAYGEFDMTLLSEVRDYSKFMNAAGGADVTQSFLTAYPEMDGIIVGGCTQYCLSGVVQAVKNSERDVKVVGIDYDENILQHMQDGVVLGFTGGNWNDDVLAACLIVNAVQGNRLCEGTVNMTTGYFVVDSVEECQKFLDVWNKGDCMIYTEEQMKNMVVSNNPDFTFEELSEINGAYSLEYILENRK